MAAREQLPTSYGVVIAEIEGRFYPLRIGKRHVDGSVLLEYGSHLHWEAEALYGIPPALGPRHLCGIISFQKYRDALDFCHRREESSTLRYRHWEVLAAHTELYPERNAWYCDEIVTMTGSMLSWGSLPGVEASGSSIVYGSVFLKGGHCFVSAPTIDDAWERLYESVCEYVAQKHTA